MGLVNRIDRGTLGKPSKDAHGFLRADAHVTRAGVFEYKQADGRIVRELRPPEEVFKADSLAAGKHPLPLLDDHPPTGLVTPADAAAHMRGAVGELRRDGDMVSASLRVMDAALIAKMEAGKVQVSCGYTCETDDTPGVDPVHGRYDAVQKNITYNHVAIVDVGRAGPEVSVRMDAGAAVQVETIEAGARMDAQEPRTMKLTINGVAYDVTEQVAQAIAQERADSAAKLTAAQTETQTQRARADAADEKVKAADKARTDAEDPARLSALVAARVQLEVEAAKHGVSCVRKDDKGAEVALTDRAVKLAVIEKIKGVKLDKEPDAYVQGRFDSAIADAAASNPHLSALRVEVGGRADAAHTAPPTPEQARKAYVQSRADAWKHPTQQEEE